MVLTLEYFWELPSFEKLRDDACHMLEVYKNTGHCMQ